jgi:hypothetical protein
VAGAIVMTYDHHKENWLLRCWIFQHDFQGTILSTQHVHLDHHHCLEIIAVRGQSQDVERLSTSLKALVGVKHLSLSISQSGDETDRHKENKGLGLSIQKRMEIRNTFQGLCVLRRTSVFRQKLLLRFWDR